MVESAIQRPYNGYYRPIARKAVALVQSVANNHGFADGNKRTALILLHTLLAKSGYELRALDENETIDAAVEEMILAAATGAMTVDEISEWLKAHIRRLS